MLKPLPRTTLLLALALGLLVNPAWASGDRPLKGLVIFGDSLSDPGNAFVLTGEVSVRPFELIPDAPYLIGGLHLSNGKTWVEQLAADYGLRRDARPAFLAPGFFSNYAVGAARARGNGPIDLTSQVGVFRSVSPRKLPGDRLYVMWLGGNDVRDAFTALTKGGSPARARGIIRAAVTTIYDNIKLLADSGACQFLVPNAPNIGLVPAITQFGPGAVLLGTMVAASFNQALEGALTALETEMARRKCFAVVRLNIFQIVTEIVDEPGSVGLTNAEDSCITPGVIRGAICRRPNEYLFWDGIHPTRAGHAILAAKAKAALAETLPVGHKSGHGWGGRIPGLASGAVR